MRHTLSLFLAILLALELIPVAFGAETVAGQIAAMPAGTHIELRLKSKEKVRGVRGPVSETGLTLINSPNGDRQISFDDVSSVRKISAKSHLRRNILIGVAVGVAIFGIVLGIQLRCGGLGCGTIPIGK